MNELTVVPEHSPIGASSMDRWSVCPGSVRLSRGLPSISNDYADEGTKAHGLASLWLMLDEKPAFDLETEEGREMHRAVSEFVHICKKYISDVAVDMGAVWGVEHRFDLTSFYPGLYGRSDFWVYWPWLKKLIVLDFKYGAGTFVSVVDNLQEQYYALGVMVTMPHLAVETVELGIVQPRCMVDGETFRTWTIDKMTLVEFGATLIAEVKETEDPNAPLVPGDHCKYCPANQHRVCSEVKAHATLVTLPLLPNKYDPVELKRELDRRPIMRAYLRALDEFAYREMQAGAQIPGYKMVDKWPSRSWHNGELVAQTLTALGFDTDTIYEPHTLKSPAQMEKALGKEFKELLTPFIKSQSSGHTVVPMDDSRQAVRLGPEAVFSVIPFDPFA